MTDGGRIAIVDDDSSVRRAVRRLVKSLGFDVVEFASAEDFLRAGGGRDSTCLLLDVQLPGMNGLELQRQMIASDSRTPIVFMSAGNDETLRARALEAGAVAFLHKPFCGHALIAAINASIRLRDDATNDPRDRDEHL